MFRCNSETDAVELVLTQKLKNFNSSLPAVISIKAVLKVGSTLSKAILSDELELEFQDKQIVRIDGVLLNFCKCISREIGDLFAQKMQRKMIFQLKTASVFCPLTKLRMM